MRLRRLRGVTRLVMAAAVAAVALFAAGTASVTVIGEPPPLTTSSIARFEPMPEFNIWIGRMLPPSDRANLYGPYYAVPWSFPGVAANHPSIFAGRDNGLTVPGAASSR